MTDHELEGAKHAYEKAAAEASMLGNIQNAISIASLLLGLVFGYMLVRYIVISLQIASKQLGRISQGHYHDIIEVKHADETGLLLYAMKSLQIRMGFEVTDAKRINDEVTRVKIGLDNVSTNVMIADKYRNIIYMNKAITEMFRNCARGYPQGISQLRCEQSVRQQHRPVPQESGASGTNAGAAARITQGDNQDRRTILSC